MEGRSHTGIMFTMNGCKDPAQEADWNHWYSTTHRTDMLKHGVFTQMTRFKKIDGLTPTAEPMYLAIYEHLSLTQWRLMPSSGSARRRIRRNCILRWQAGRRRS